MCLNTCVRHEVKQGGSGCRRNILFVRNRSESERLLFHVDEGMSWESVRDLSQMRKMLLLIQNLCNDDSVPTEVTECVDEVIDILKEILQSDANRR